MLTKLDKDSTKGYFPGVKGKKRKMAELLVNPDNDMTVSEMCKQIKVSRTTFYNWMNESEFKNYLDWLIDNYTDSELANVWKALIKKATKSGDVQAQKLYFELKDKYKQQIDLNNKVVIVDDLNS